MLSSPIRVCVTLHMAAIHTVIMHTRTKLQLHGDQEFRFRRIYSFSL